MIKLPWGSSVTASWGSPSAALHFGLHNRQRDATSDGIRIIKYLSIRQNLEIENMTKMISEYIKEHINPDGLKITDEILNELRHETNYKGQN